MTLALWEQLHFVMAPPFFPSLSPGNHTFGAILSSFTCQGSEPTSNIDASPDVLILGNPVPQRSSGYHHHV